MEHAEMDTNLPPRTGCSRNIMSSLSALSSSSSSSSFSSSRLLSSKSSLRKWPPPTCHRSFPSSPWNKMVQRIMRCISWSLTRSNSLWVFIFLGCILSVVQSDDNVSLIDPSFSSISSDIPFDEAVVEERTAFPMESRDEFHKNIDVFLSSNTTAENVTKSSSKSIASITHISKKIPIEQFSTPMLYTNYSSNFSYISTDSHIQPSSFPLFSSSSSQVFSESNIILKESSTQHESDQVLKASSLPKTPPDIPNSLTSRLDSVDSGFISETKLSLSDTASVVISSEHTVIFEDEIKDPSTRNTFQSNSIVERPMIQSSGVKNSIESASELPKTNDTNRVSESILQSQQTKSIHSSNQLLQSESKTPQLLSSGKSFASSEHSTESAQDQVQNAITSMPLLPSFSRSVSDTESEFSRSQILPDINTISVIGLHNNNYDGFKSDTVSVFHLSRSDVSNIKTFESSKEVFDFDINSHSPSFDNLAVKPEYSTQVLSNILSSFSSSIHKDSKSDMSGLLQTEFITSITPIAGPQDHKSGRSDNPSKSFSLASLVDYKSNDVVKTESYTETKPFSISRTEDDLPSESSLGQSLDIKLDASSESNVFSESSINNQRSVPFIDDNPSIQATDVPNSRFVSHATEFIKPSSTPSVPVRSTGSVPTHQLQTEMDEDSYTKGNDMTATVDEIPQGQSSQEAVASIQNNIVASDEHSDLTSELKMNNSPVFYDSINPSPTRTQGANVDSNNYSPEDSSLLDTSSTLLTQYDGSKASPIITSIVDVTSGNNDTMALERSIPSDVSTVQSFIMSSIGVDTHTDNIIDNSEMTFNSTISPASSIRESDSALVPTNRISLSENYTSSENVILSSESERTFPDQTQTPTITSMNSTTPLVESEMLTQRVSSSVSSVLGNTTTTENKMVPTTSILRDSESASGLNINKTNAFSTETFSGEKLETHSLIIEDSTHSTSMLLDSHSNSKMSTSNMTLDSQKDTIVTSNPSSSKSPSVEIQSNETTIIAITPTLTQRSSLHDLGDKSLLSQNQSVIQISEYLNLNSSMVEDYGESISDIGGNSLIEASIQRSEVKPTSIISPNKTMNSIEAVEITTELPTTIHSDTMFNFTDIHSSFSTMTDLSGFSSDTPSILMSHFPTLDSNFKSEGTITHDVNETSVSPSTMQFQNNMTLKSNMHSMESNFGSIQVTSLDNNPSFANSESSFNIPQNISSFSSQFETLDNTFLSQNVASDMVNTPIIASVDLTESIDPSQSIQASVNATHSFNTNQPGSGEISSEIINTIFTTAGINITASSLPESINGQENATSFSYIPMESTASIETSFSSLGSDFLESATVKHTSMFTNTPTASRVLINSTSTSNNTDTNTGIQNLNSTSEYLDSLNLSTFESLGTSVSNINVSSTIDLLQSSIRYDDLNMSTADLEDTSLQGSESMTGQQNLSSSRVNPSTDYFQTMDIETTPSSNFADLESALSTNNDSSSPEFIEPTKVQFNLSSTFIDAIETDIILGNFTSSSVVEVSSLQDNSNSSIDLLQSLTQDNFSTVLSQSDILETTGSSLYYSNTTIVTDPATSSSPVVNSTNSLDVSPELSVSLIDFISTPFLDSSQIITHFEDSSQFTSSIQNENVSLTTGFKESVMSHSSLDLTHIEISTTPVYNMSTSWEMTTLQTTEANTTSGVAPSISDVIVPSMKSENVTTIDVLSSGDLIYPTDIVLTGSLTMMNTDNTKATAIYSTPSSLHSSNETITNLLSSSVTNFTETPDVSSTTDGASSTFIQNSLFPTPTSTLELNVSSEGIESSRQHSPTSPSATSLQSSDNVTTGVPDSASHHDTTPFDFNSTTDQILSLSTSQESEINPTTPTSTIPVQMSSPPVNASEVFASPSAINQTMFNSDSVTPTSDIFPSMIETSAYNQSSVNAASILINLSSSPEHIVSFGSPTPAVNTTSTIMPTLPIISSSITNLTSDTPILNTSSTIMQTLPSQSSMFSIGASSELNASLTTTSPINASISTTPYLDLNSSQITDSISSTSGEIASSLSSMYVNTSSISSQVIISSLTESLDTSIIHTSRDITPNYTTSSSPHPTATINNTMDLQSSISIMTSENVTGSISESNIFISTTSLPGNTTLIVASSSSDINFTMEISHGGLSSEIIFSTPISLSSTIMDIVSNSSTSDSSSSMGTTSNVTFISPIASATQIPETLSEIPSLTPSEIITNVTSSPIISTSPSVINPTMATDLENTTVLSSLSSNSSAIQTASIFDSTLESPTTGLSSSFSPTPSLSSDYLPSQFSNATEIDESTTDTTTTMSTTSSPNETISISSTELFSPLTTEMSESSNLNPNITTSTTSTSESNMTISPSPISYLSSSLMTTSIPESSSSVDTSLTSSFNDTASISTTDSPSPIIPSPLATEIFDSSSLISSTTKTTISITPTTIPSESSMLISSSLMLSSSSSSIEISTLEISSTPSSSSPIPQPTSSSVPTGSTLPTIDNSGHLTSYWVSVGLLIRTNVDVNTPQFKADIEQGLANAYALSRKRQEEIDNGTFESLGKKRRRKRAATAVNDPNVKVEVTSIEREGSTTNVDVNHVLQEDGALVPADDAAKQMALLNDMELAIQLNQVVAQTPKPYITPTTSSDDDDDDTTIMIAGIVLGAVVALVILVVILCCGCGGNRCCIKRSSGEFRISDLSEKRQVVPTSAAENPSYYVDDESHGNTTMSVTSKKGKYTLAEDVMDGTDKRNGRPMPARRPPHGKKNSVDHQRPVSSAESEDVERKSSPKKKKGKKKKEMDTDEAMEMRSIYESQIASLQESPIHTQMPQAVSPIDLVITGPPTVEMEEDLLENAEEERKKNKQRLREKRRKEKESPIKKPQDQVDIVYESAQKEIDKVLGPRKDALSAEKSRKKSKDKKKKKEKSDDSGDNSQQEEGPPNDSLEEARVKIHRLLDDAFSLISQSRSSMGNKVHPTSQQSSIDKGSPRSQQSHRSHSSIEQADQDVEETVVQEKKHTPLYVERSHGAYDRSGLISWSPYRASDDTALISLPNTQTNLNSVAPQGEPIKGTTVFSESLPNSLQPHYYTTLPGEPIVLRTKDLDSNNQPQHHHSHNIHSRGGDTINIKSNYNAAVTGDPEVNHRKHQSNEDELYTPYYGLSSYHELPPSTVLPNSTYESSNERYLNKINSFTNNQDYHSNSDNDRNLVNNDSNFHDVTKTHVPPGRGGESNGKDFVDVIKHSVQPGASPQPLIHSLREELLNLSRKKGLSSDSNNLSSSGRGENGMEKTSTSSKMDGKPPSGMTSHGQDVYYRNNRNRHMKTDL